MPFLHFPSLDPPENRSRSPAAMATAEPLAAAEGTLAAAGDLVLRGSYGTVVGPCAVEEDGTTEATGDGGREVFFLDFCGEDLVFFGF